MTFWGTGQTGQTDKQTNIWTDRLFSENIILDEPTDNLFILVVNFSEYCLKNVSSIIEI